MMRRFWRWLWHSEADEAERRQRAAEREAAARAFERQRMLLDLIELQHMAYWRRHGKDSHRCPPE